jgi:hypothetical protein
MRTGEEPEPLLGEEQARADEDQHDGEYHLERPAWQPRGYPAPDEDAGDAAEEERPCQSEVHVALGHVGESHDQREHRGVSDVRPDYDRWGYRV